MESDPGKASFMKLGVEVDGPTLQPWHTREILITDPDGCRLNFIEPAWRPWI